MFRNLPRTAVLSLAGLQSGLWTTGAATAVMTPSLAKRNLSAVAPDVLQAPDWDLVESASRLRIDGIKILHLFGEVMDFDGNPIPNARIDIWQAGPDGSYRDADLPTTSAFRGFGSAITDDLGHFMFRTILPIAYGNKAPHIHARVSRPRGRTLETRIYLVDAPENDRDWHYGSLGPSQQAALSIDPVERHDGDLEAGFNFVV
ncbi:MAG: hypothetical protein AAF557_19050 [Pseudomonadota bacterium]